MIEWKIYRKVSKSNNSTKSFGETLEGLEGKMKNFRKTCEILFFFCKLWQCSFTIILGCVPDEVVMRLTG